MNKRDRSELFARYVGLALKGRIVTQGMTAKAVATTMHRSPAAFNRWLNGKVEIPLSVFAEACEVIDVEPQQLIEDAYARLCVEQGERDGATYEDAADDHSFPGEHDNVIVGGFGQNAHTEEEIPENVEEEWAGRFAASPMSDIPEDHTP